MTGIEAGPLGCREGLFDAGGGRSCQPAPQGRWAEPIPCQLPRSNICKVPGLTDVSGRPCFQFFQVYTKWNCGIMW